MWWCHSVVGRAHIVGHHPKNEITPERNVSIYHRLKLLSFMSNVSKSADCLSMYPEFHFVNICLFAKCIGCLL